MLDQPLWVLDANPLISRQFHLCRDARDNPFLDVAFSGQANAIVTGDQDLLVLRAFEGVPIVSPADFLAV